MGKLYNIFETISTYSKTTACPLCGREAKVVHISARKHFVELECPNCKLYAIQPEFINLFDDAEHAYLLSGYFRHEWRPPMTVTNLSVDYANQIINELTEKVNVIWSMAYVIFYYEQKMTNMESWCQYDSEPAIGYCKDEEDLSRIISMAVICGYMELEDDRIRATESGMEFSEKVRFTNMDKERQKINELIVRGKVVGKDELHTPERGFPVAYVSGPKYRKWIAEVKTINERLLKSHPLHKNIDHMCKNYNNNPNAFEEIMSCLETIEEDKDFWDERQKSDEREEDVFVVNKRVFIVHGRNQSIRDEVELCLHRAGLEPIILAEEASNGMTIIEKIEAYSDVAYAVVLYTGCDLGKYREDDGDPRPRARQNVVFEHGYMVAKLGRRNVVALVEDGVEEPGDLSGVVYISMNDTDWKMKLFRELQSAGLELKI